MLVHKLGNWLIGLGVARIFRCGVVLTGIVTNQGWKWDKMPVWTSVTSTPSLLPTIVMTSFSALGVYIQENFRCDMHFKHIITVSCQRQHLLKALRRQEGVSLELLHCVFHAILSIKLCMLSRHGTVS